MADTSLGKGKEGGLLVGACKTGTVSSCRRQRKAVRVSPFLPVTIIPSAIKCLIWQFLLVQYLALI
jgi:ABC-type sugar transport system permease subunit